MRSSDNPANVLQRWDFNRWDDFEGWTVEPPLTGAVFGGALWLKINPGRPEPAKWTAHCQVYPPDESITAYSRWQEWLNTGSMSPHPPSGGIASPEGLGIEASKAKKVRMRVRNLSPETDWLLFWSTSDSPGVDAGAVRLVLEPYLTDWQDVVCHVDDRWSGTIDRIRLLPGLLHVRGEVCIDWIAITDGAARPPVVRPDVAGEGVVPSIDIPGIPQEDFRDAFKVLDECLYADVPIHGFAYPFMSPGGGYGPCWWEFDTSLNIAGAKWANQEFAEGVIRGFIGVQDPDGRFDLWGLSPMRGLAADSSAMPWYFEAAYDVARRSGDRELVGAIYQSMKAYVDWWLSPVKRDGTTGLITATFEETHGEPLWDEPQAVAPVDLNVLVAVGCRNVAELANWLGSAGDARFYRNAVSDLITSIDRYMWDEQHGAFFNYHVRQRRRIERLICTTFEPMRLRAAPQERVERLVRKLLDPALFNWGTLPVTSLAKTEPDYVEVTGRYESSAWYGSIWSLRNYSVVMALEGAGRHDLAAQLAWTTVKAFNANYREFLVPSSGSGEGVERYGFSASNYIQLVIEHLFGIDYDRIKNRLRLFPHVPTELKGQELSIRNLILPAGGDTRLNVTLRRLSDARTSVSIDLSGPVPNAVLEFVQARPPAGTARVVDHRDKRLPFSEAADDLVNVVAVRTVLRESMRLVVETTPEP